jgi:GNAT superfamily N-acetyltransferase
VVAEPTLDTATRVRLRELFRGVPRVDCGIDAVLEGPAGRVLVDDPAHPRAAALAVGPFWYLAGDAELAAAPELLDQIPPWSLLMPSGPKWEGLADERLGDRLERMPRVSFAPDLLAPDHLEALVAASPHHDFLQPLDGDRAAALAAAPYGWLDLDGFTAPADFAARGFGYALVDGETVGGAAWTSLSWSRGVEVSVFVEPAHRSRGVATVLAARLVRESLARGLRPNWDAANPESCRLAERLGYVRSGTYLARYLRP